MEALNRCKGFIRSSLAKKLTIRKTPSLIFVIDDSFERGMKIEKLIIKMKRQPNGIRFQELAKVLEYNGYIMKSKKRNIS